jgi:hypothetical protein
MTKSKVDNFSPVPAEPAPVEQGPGTTPPIVPVAGTGMPVIGTNLFSPEPAVVNPTNEDPVTGPPVDPAS